MTTTQNTNAAEAPATRVFDATDLMDNWEERERRDGGSHPCFMCGRKINTSRPFFEIYYGGMGTIRREYDAYDPTIDGDDMGCYEIGPECRKRLPDGFAHKRPALAAH